MTESQWNSWFRQGNLTRFFSGKKKDLMVSMFTLSMVIMASLSKITLSCWRWVSIWKRCWQLMLITSTTTLYLILRQISPKNLLPLNCSKFWTRRITLDTWSRVKFSCVRKLMPVGRIKTVMTLFLKSRQEQQLLWDMTFQTTLTISTTTLSS